MAKTKIFTGERCSWTFDGAGGMRDQLEQTILSELAAKEYPFPSRIQELKSGGFFGTKEQCVVVDVGKGAEIVISNTTIGTYLYVEMHNTIKGQSFFSALISMIFFFLPSSSSKSDDVFKEQRLRAAFAAAKAASKSAFAKLELKENNNYQGHQTK